MANLKISSFTKACMDYGICNIILFEGGNTSMDNVITIRATVYTNNGFTKHDVRLRSLTLEAGLNELISKAKAFKEIDATFAIEKEFHATSDSPAYAQIKDGKVDIIDDII